ncbi:MAG: molybdopterin-binding protein [Sedimentisphaerales bacterium]|nr:molybdopterin-binding protein [Sedimentisphaerales bacterium]
MSNYGQVISVNISKEKGVAKQPVGEIVIDNHGVVNDAHAGPWHRQVSLLSQEDINGFAATMGQPIACGEFAENITVSGIDLSRAAVLDSFRIGAVELQISQIGKKCHGDGCAIYQQVGKCVMPQKGLFCRVISGGKVAAGDAVELVPRMLNVLVITLSDRASTGEYADRSGPRAKQLLEEYFADKRWHLRIDTILMADDAVRLRRELEQAMQRHVDVIFTLGGTGIGPRDITPETITSLGGKTIPGIMENIRIKFGTTKPSALLSRSVAAITQKTQIYALPGSVRAVEEYLSEITKILEHAIFMVHGLDVH